MPARWWKHDCPCAEPERTDEACAQCDSRGEDVGWRMTDEDRDQVFLWATGIVRPEAGDSASITQAVGMRLVACTLCAETGLVQPDGPKDGWDWCPVCHGLGGGFEEQFTYKPPGQGIAMIGIIRFAAIGHSHPYRRGGSVRRNLDEAELIQLRDWLSDQGFGYADPSCQPSSAKRRAGSR